MLGHGHCLAAKHDGGLRARQNHEEIRGRKTGATVILMILCSLYFDYRYGGLKARQNYEEGRGGKIGAKTMLFLLC